MFNDLFVASLALTPVIMVFVMFSLWRQNNRLWRDTIIYLRSKSAYEAEDAIDRQEGRGKGILQKGVDKMRKEKENLRRQAPSEVEVLERDIERVYKKNPKANKSLT